jgi:hypothetical protein
VEEFVVVLLQLEPLPLLIGVCFVDFPLLCGGVSSLLYMLCQWSQNPRGGMIQIHRMILYNNMSQKDFKKCVKKHGCHYVRTSLATL